MIRNVLGRRWRLRIGFVGVEDGFNILVDAISSNTNTRTADDLVCIGCEYAKGKVVADVHGKANEEALMSAGKVGS